MGLVLHGKEPAPDVAVKLCSDYNYDSGCIGERLFNTNEEGYYIFSNIAPGEYVIVLHISGSIILLTVDGYETKDTSGSSYSLSPIYRKYAVAAGQTRIIEPQYIYKDDLVTVSPKEGEKVNALPTFKWDEYLDAAYYELTVKPYKYSSKISSIGPIKVEGTEYTFAEPLPGCRYASWGVEAFDKEGRKIGSTYISGSATHLSVSMTVENPDFSCELKVISPKDYAEINGAEGIEFSWEPNPMATCYRITFYDDWRNVVNEYKIDNAQSSYKIDSMPKGIYKWNIVACDATGKTIAFGEIHGHEFTLIVR